MDLSTTYRLLLVADKPLVLCLYSAAVSKERARISANGHVYTPERTRKYEKYIKQAAETWNRKPYMCPVAMTVIITDPIPKSYSKTMRRAASLGLIYPKRGDLDNKVKAISDGLNGVAYVDDVQVVDLVAARRFGDSYKIDVEIRRAGLTLSEIRSAEKTSVKDTRPSVEMGKQGSSGVPLQHGQKPDDTGRVPRRRNRRGDSN